MRPPTEKDPIMNARTVTKKITAVVVGLGTSKITADIITKHAQPNNLVQGVTIVVASVFIGMMAADKTSQYTETKIDEMFDWFDQTKSELKKTDTQEA